MSCQPRYTLRQGAGARNTYQEVASVVEIVLDSKAVDRIAALEGQVAALTTQNADARIMALESRVAALEALNTAAAAALAALLARVDVLTA